MSCGDNGVRTRVRFLEANSKPTPGVPVALTGIDVPYDPPDYERYSKEAGLSL